MNEDEWPNGVSRGPWSPDRESRDAGRRVHFEILPHPDLKLFPMGITLGSFDTEGETHADALTDMARLIEEFRFETAVAQMYSHGVKREVRELRARMEEHPHSLGFSNRARAMLVSYTSAGVDPSELIDNPQMPIAGTRVLGGWWAAQLYDSAMMRGTAILDRLVTLLFCIEGRPVDPNWMPVFRHRTLRQLVTWAGEPEWKVLLDTLDHELFELAKGYRDGLVHRHRYSAELHGDHLVGRWEEGAWWNELGIKSESHFALVAAFYNEVLLPAIQATGDLIARTMEERGVERASD